MATRTWKHGLWLGLVGFSLATGCVVSGDDDDDDTGGGGEAGDSSGGTSTGGTSGKGGSSGSSTGGSSTGGSTGGSTTGGTGGSTGGSTTGGSSGTGGMDTDPECDPDQGELMNTAYPDCEPRDTDDACELCIQANCCEESRVCYGYSPGNVCGWGGPTSGDYAGMSELDCYISCAQDYVDENGVYDEGAQEACAACATPGCGPIGNATNEMIVCMQDHCEDDCFTP
jgi:hypothetical protein